MGNRNSKPVRLGQPPADWLEFFRGAKVEIDRLEAAKSRQGQVTVAANFLARMVDREVPIEVDGRAGKATLRVAPGRSRRKVYYFEVVFEDDDQSGSDEDANDGPQPLGGKTIASRKRPRMEEKTTERDNPINRSPALGYVPAGNDEAW